jgi:hypothetical protein
MTGGAAVIGPFGAWCKPRLRALDNGGGASASVVVLM